MREMGLMRCRVKVVEVVKLARVVRAVRLSRHPYHPHPTSGRQAFSTVFYNSSSTLTVRADSGTLLPRGDTRR